MPDFSVAVQDAVYEQLNVAAVNDVAGVEGDVRGFQHVPEDTQPPLWIIGDISVEPAGGKDGGLDRLTVEIASMVREPKRAALYALMAAVRGQLEDQELPAQPGAELSRPVFESSDDQLLEDGETYLGIQRFSLYAQFAFVNAEAEAVVARMAAEPNEARKRIIDDYVGAMKASGVWAKRDVLFVLAAHDQQASLIDWKNLGGAGACDLAIATGAPAFLTDRGWTGTSADFLESGNTIPGAGGALSQDDAHYSCYVLLSSTSTQPDVNNTADANAQVYCGRSAVGGKVNTTTLLTMTVLGADAARNICLIRRASNAQLGFENGLQTHSDASVSTNTFLQIRTGRTNRRTAIVAGGVALSDAEALAAHNADSAFLVAIGAL